MPPLIQVDSEGTANPDGLTTVGGSTGAGASITEVDTSILSQSVRTTHVDEKTVAHALLKQAEESRQKQAQIQRKKELMEKNLPVKSGTRFDV